MPSKFIQDIHDGKIPGFTVDPNHPMLSFTSADMYSPPGTIVQYTGHNGSEADQHHANKHLKIGTNYTLERSEVGGFHTDFLLKEVPGKMFNSVHFAAVDPNGKRVP